MRKDNRDCSMPYPIYPPYQGMNMVPNMPVPYGMPGMMMQNGGAYTSTNNNMTNNLEQQINNLEQQINNLENRISTLENMYNNSITNNKYSSSNFQMM